MKENQKRERVDEELRRKEWNKLWKELTVSAFRQLADNSKKRLQQSAVLIDRIRNG